MKIIYNTIARGVHGIAHELPTIADAYRHRDRMQAKGYTTEPPRAFDDVNGRRLYIVYAWRKIEIE